MTAEERVAKILDAAIANLGYPAGCGLAPHPETTKKIAKACVAAAQEK